jgi:hypothetical protein
MKLRFKVWEKSKPGLMKHWFVVEAENAARAILVGDERLKKTGGKVDRRKRVVLAKKNEFGGWQI